MAAACGSDKSPIAPSPVPASPVEPTAVFALSGRVIDQAADAPVVAARVEAVHAGAAVASGAAETDEDGHYHLGNLSAGDYALRVWADGFDSSTLSVAIDNDKVVDLALTRTGTSPEPPAPEITGQAIDVLTDRPLAGVTVAIDGAGETVTDGAGAFTLIGAELKEFQPITIASSSTIERRTHVRTSGGDRSITLIPRSIDLRSLDEMLRVRGGLHRWVTAPRVVIERRVLIFTNTSAMSYTASADRMSEADVSQLAADLTWALPQLTGGVFTAFARIDVELAAEGQAVSISRPDTIVVARYDGLNGALAVLGYGRWAWNAAGEVRTAALMLDDAFDRAGASSRRALRSHELGHTLGYDHVSTPVSTMHQSGQIEPTAFDRDATKIAFRRKPLNVSPDIDPDPSLAHPSSAHLSWAGAH